MDSRSPKDKTASLLRFDHSFSMDSALMNARSSPTTAAMSDSAGVEVLLREESAGARKVPLLDGAEDCFRLRFLPAAQELCDLLELVRHLGHGGGDEDRPALDLALARS